MHQMKFITIFSSNSDPDCLIKRNTNFCLSIMFPIGDIDSLFRILKHATSHNITQAELYSQIVFIPKS